MIGSTMLGMMSIMNTKQWFEASSGVYITSLSELVEWLNQCIEKNPAARVVSWQAFMTEGEDENWYRAIVMLEGERP